MKLSSWIYSISHKGNRKRIEYYIFSMVIAQIPTLALIINRLIHGEGSPINKIFLINHYFELNISIILTGMTVIMLYISEKLGEIFGLENRHALKLCLLVYFCVIVGISVNILDSGFGALYGARN